LKMMATLYDPFWSLLLCAGAQLSPLSRFNGRRRRRQKEQDMS
jgi:hypothetical protein